MNLQRSVTMVNDDTLMGMIQQAQRRIILMTPGVTEPVAKVLAAKWQSLSPEAVTVILDVSSSALRLGYGDLSGLKLLESTAASLGMTIDRQDGIRIGLLIVDDETVVYSPTARLIEAGPKREKTPNAIRLGIPPADVERDLGAGPEGILERSLGLDKAEVSEIKKVEEELKLCPPQKFDVARQVQVFNAYFEYVELRLSGICIQRKTIQIPTDLLLALDKQTQQKIHTTYRLIEPDDELSSTTLMDDRTRLVKKHLRQIRGHGTVIQRAKKEAFLAEFKLLSDAVAAFREKVRKSLADKLKERREALEKELLPVVLKQPPARWKSSIYFNENQPEEPHELLRQELTKAFGTAEDLVGAMEAKVVFKAVTYESLQDEKFMDLAHEAFPEMNFLYDEQIAVEGRPLEPAPPLKGAA